MSWFPQGKTAGALQFIAEPWALPMSAPYVRFRTTCLSKENSTKSSSGWWIEKNNPHKAGCSFWCYSPGGALLSDFAVFIDEIKIRLISRQSESSDSDILSSIYSDLFNRRSQYSVSAVSLREICSLEIKSALLFPYCASLMLAHMEVPLLRICLEMIFSRLVSER